VQARGVDQHELGPGQVADADDPVAGGLGLVGNDRDLFVEDPVEQGLLADIGPADQGNETGAEIFIFRGRGKVFCKRCGIHGNT
jgi:hypothetical protein